MFGQTAPMIQSLTCAAITDGQLLASGVFILTLIFMIPLVGIITSAWTGVIKLRLKAELKQQVIALKQQMIERGMTADEIVKVLGPPSGAPDDLSVGRDDEMASVGGPYASEVVVEREGEWHPALVLGHEGSRCFIHTCPGYGVADMSENEWVGVGRVRFPSPSVGQDGSPWGPADHTAAFGAGQPMKDPVPAEV
jgi:hypothetical protein